MEAAGTAVCENYKTKEKEGRSSMIKPMENFTSPCTLNGWTASTNGMIVPEYKRNRYFNYIPEGAELWRITDNGWLNTGEAWDVEAGWV